MYRTESFLSVFGLVLKKTKCITRLHPFSFTADKLTLKSSTKLFECNSFRRFGFYYKLLQKKINFFCKKNANFYAKIAERMFFITFTAFPRCEILFFSSAETVVCKRQHHIPCYDDRNARDAHYGKDGNARQYEDVFHLVALPPPLLEFQGEERYFGYKHPAAQHYERHYEHYGVGKVTDAASTSYYQ